MSNPIRDKAKKFLDQVPAYPAEVWSDRERALFTTLTGYTHDKLVAVWNGGGKDKNLTTCNAFTSIYGKFLGPKGYVMGAFEPEKKEFLGKEGRPHAWITPGGDRRPKFGDVFVKLPRYSHVGISLDFDGEVWNTVESGQGIVGERDKLKRCKRTFDANTLAGWVDIEILLEPDPPPISRWVIGWWKVAWRNRIYYYYLGADGMARWTDWPPSPVTPAPLEHCAPRTGVFTFSYPDGVTIRWFDTGNTEVFAREPCTVADDMKGLWNGSEDLVATKL